MNSPDEEIEALLGRVAPAAPDPALMERLRAARPLPRRRSKILYLWAPLAAAAGLAFALLPSSGPDQGPGPVGAGDPPETDAPKPVASLQHLMEVTDLGVTRDANQMPVRLIRTRWMDEIIYDTPPGEEPVTEGRLREEVLPVSLPIY